MARLYSNTTQISLHIGWYGRCKECEPFSLTEPSTRAKIWKVFQVTSDEKGYVRFDANMPSMFDSFAQHFTELKCGYSYNVILKSGASEEDYLDIPGFTKANAGTETGQGLITNECECDNQYTPTPTLTSETTPTPQFYVDLVVRVEKQPEYDAETFDVIVSNIGNLTSSGDEVHQFFKNDSSVTSLLSSDDVYDIISAGEPTEDQILIVNYEELGVTIIDGNKLRFNNPIQPSQEILIKIKLNTFEQFLIKVDSTDTEDESNVSIIDAELNNVAVVNNPFIPTPTPSETLHEGTSFSFGIRENKTGGVSAEPTWLLGPDQFSISNLPVLNLENNLVRIYINQRLSDGTETGKVDWVALPEFESVDMTGGITLGANYDEDENTIMNTISSSQKITLATTITSGQFSAIGWFVTLNDENQFLEKFDSPTLVAISGTSYMLQEINGNWLVTSETGESITENGPSSGTLVFEQGTQIQVQNSQPGWRVDVGTRVVLPIIGGGNFYNITKKLGNDVFIIDGTFDNLSGKKIAIDIPSFLLNTSNFKVSPSFQTHDDYKYWVTTGIGASWTNHPKELDLNKYVIEYIEFEHPNFIGVFDT